MHSIFQQFLKYANVCPKLCKAAFTPAQHALVQTRLNTTEELNNSVDYHIWSVLEQRVYRTRINNNQWRFWGFHLGGALGWRHFHLGGTQLILSR